MIVRILGNAEFLADSADFGDVGLDVVHGSPFDPLDKRLAPGEDFTAGNGQRRVFGQFHVTLEIIRPQRFLEPGNLVVRQHPRGLQSPFVAVRPEGIRTAGVHHQFDTGTHRFARGLDDGFIGLPVAAAERAPPDLEGPESPAEPVFQRGSQYFGFIHQQGTVRFDVIAVAASQEPADGLAGDLAENVPESDVDARDGMGDGPPAALPECLLVASFGSRRRIQSGGADQERPHHFDGAPDQPFRSEYAAHSGHAFVGNDLDQGVQVVLEIGKLVIPSAIGGFTAEREETDISNLHWHPNPLTGGQDPSIG